MVKLFDGKAVVSGVGKSQIGRNIGREGLELTAEACLRAIADAGLCPEDIDGLATYPGAGNPSRGFVGSGAYETLDALGLHVNWFTGTEETPGQLGPVITACAVVASGLARHVLVFRTLTESSAQKGRGRRAVMGGESSKGAGDVQWGEWIPAYGGNPPNLHAMRAQQYMYEYGLTAEQLAWVALNDRRHAMLNPDAILRTPLTMDDYLKARMISTPLRLLDCDIPCDGSTAVVISHIETAPDLRKQPVRVESAGCSMRGRARRTYCELGKSSLHDSGDFLWAHTELKPSDVDVAELYDGFSIHTLLWLEGLHFCKIGEAGDFVDGGKRIGLDGELPLNTQGGQLSGGRLHGLGFLHEACTQLWGEAGDRQVPGNLRVAAVSAGADAFAGCMLLVRD